MSYGEDAVVPETRHLNPSKVYMFPFLSLPMYVSYPYMC